MTEQTKAQSLAAELLDYGNCSDGTVDEAAAYIITQGKALSDALKALENCRTFWRQDWSSEETTRPDVLAAIKRIKELQ